MTNTIIKAAKRRVSLAAIDAQLRSLAQRRDRGLINETDYENRRRDLEERKRGTN